MISGLAIRRFVISVTAACACLVWFPAHSMLIAQRTTEDRLEESGFWPRKGSQSATEYAGASSCTLCHASIVASQTSTPMAITLMRAEDSAILKSHPVLSFDVGRYRYEIRTNASSNTYSVTDGASNLKATLSWAFGSGSVGQSYLFERPNGLFYEARVSYFDSLKALGFTPGRALSSPDDLEQAANRWVSPDEVFKCFSCHATGSSTGGKFDKMHLILGVTCEACHGPGKKHIEVMNMAIAKGRAVGGNAGIFGAANLSPTDAVDFCGSCHGSYWDVTLMATTEGVETSRFQPYRLEQSKCWGNEGEARLACTRCHDPHKQLETDLRRYDVACLSCHSGPGNGRTIAKGSGRSCPVDSKNCTSCHMPNVYVPEMHRSFRDHRIQVVRSRP